MSPILLEEPYGEPLIDTRESDCGLLLWRHEIENRCSKSGQRSLFAEMSRIDIRLLAYSLSVSDTLQLGMSQSLLASSNEFPSPSDWK